jgi:hypothetical protein
MQTDPLSGEISEGQLPWGRLLRIFDMSRPDERWDLQTLGNALYVELRNVYTPRRWALIPIPRPLRTFFPGYKEPFELETDVGVITTRVTSAPGGTSVGDRREGTYIQGGLRPWYDRHLELKDGAILRIEVLEPDKRYDLSIVPSTD